MIETRNEEISMLRELAAVFSRKELAPNREYHDRFPFAPFFSDVLAKAYDAGFLTIGLSDASQGAGRGIRELSVILGEISQKDSSLAGIIFSSALAQRIILEAGSGELFSGPLPPRDIFGGSLIALPSFTSPLEEPHSVVARKKGAGFRLSGRIAYLVLGGIASRALVPARHEGGDGFSYFLVDTSSDGARVSKPIIGMGLRSCPAVDMTLDDARALLVGSKAEGAAYFRRAADLMSIPIAATAVGIMKGSFDEALTYTRERFQGGREIINWSEVRMILAHMALGITVAELATASATRLLEDGASGWEDSARAAAIYAAESACTVTADGVQLLGGNGYMTDYGQEKRFRDARQVQALLGLLPMKKLAFIGDIIEKGLS